MKWLPYVLLFIVWFFVSFLAHTPLIPSPFETVGELYVIASQWENWAHFLITLFRGVSGVLLSLIFAIICGIPCGFSDKLWQMFKPIVMVLQSSPTVIWVSILLVWIGSGTGICILSVFVATFPPLFANIANGTSCIDKKLLQMAWLYRVSHYRIIREFVIPSISSYIVSALSYVLGVTWKVVTTVEFICASSGVGSRVFWAYRDLNMKGLFCWMFIVICFGLFVDSYFVCGIRKRALAKI